MHWQPDVEATAFWQALLEDAKFGLDILMGS